MHGDGFPAKRFVLSWMKLHCVGIDKVSFFFPMRSIGLRQMPWFLRPSPLLRQV